MMHARRALLYMPGNDRHKIEKAISLQVDSICMDLEDSVALNRKEEARATIVRALTELDFGFSERLVRINPVDSTLAEADLNAILPARPDGIVVPKVASAVSLRWVEGKIAAVETALGWEAGEISLIAIVETPWAVIHLPEICAATPRLTALVFGAEDMAVGLGATRTGAGWEVFHVRSALVLHAAAYGLQAIDMVKIDFSDTPGLLEEARQGVEMGCTGKQVIHPRQVVPVQETFTPSDESILAARELVNTYNQYLEQGTGTFALEGKMVDFPLLRAAENLLARARAAGKIA